MKEKCDRNGATCGMDNRIYCSIQMSMANQEILMKLTERVDMLIGPSVVPIQPEIQNKESEEEI